jgi:hypothetical protein
MTSRRQVLGGASAALVGTALFGPCRVIADGPPKRLVFIHGRGQAGMDPAVLKANWLAALQRGLDRHHDKLPATIEVAFPFYGDKLEEFAKKFDIPLTSTIQARGNALDDEFLAFQFQVAEQLRQGAGVSDEQVDAEYVGPAGERGPLNWKWVQAILRALDKHGPGGMNQKTIELFTRDVFIYSTRAGVRDEIDRIVATQLTEEPTVVVGHSLGTVVAYSILSRDQRKLTVPRLVTVGSPLGVRAVRDQFRPLRSPASVSAWFNAFDPRDVVALYPLDHANFPVAPPVANYSKVQNHTDNRHGIDGYLDDPEVSHQIIGALRA